MRWGTAALSCALVLGSLGCSHSGASAPAKYAGDTRGRACLEALPSLDVPDSLLSTRMRAARALSAESLELPAPPMPSDRSAASLTQWSEHELKAWLGEKQRLAEAAQGELDRAAVESHRERILAGALLGLVFEDVARSVLLVPLPSELEREPEIAHIFRELLLKQAEPYLKHARRAYSACAGNAAGLDAMAHWSEFCSAREQSLPQVSDEFAPEFARAP